MTAPDHAAAGTSSDALPCPPFPVLQPNLEASGDKRYLPATPATVLWGRLPAPSDAPVLTVDSGASLIIDTVSHEGLLPDQGSDPVAFFGRYGVPPEQVLEDAVAIAATVSRNDAEDGPHVITGPVHVRGALPGDVLKVTIDRLEPRVPYGVISNRHGRGALPNELPRNGGSVSVFAPVEERDGSLVGTMPAIEGGPRSVSFPLAPFLGTIGVSASAAERLHSVPPGAHGGNIDVSALVEGTAIYLPVQIAGAGLYLGDPHFAQGDGEVALTALEASLRATITCEVIPQRTAQAAFGALSAPLIRTPRHLVPLGLDADLNEAMRSCVRAALTLMTRRWGMDEHLAYAYLSASADFAVSQVVDGVCGIHAFIRESDFADIACEVDA